jgi:membrane-bound metal-dependent hydrolase YbcI (DUF457 family)
MVARQLHGPVGREAASNRHPLRQPVEIGRPRVGGFTHSIFFMFFLGMIIFFVVPASSLLLLPADYCCFVSHEWNNKAS